MNMIKKVARLIKLYTTGIGPMPMRGYVSKKLMSQQPAGFETIGYYNKKGKLVCIATWF